MQAATQSPASTKRPRKASKPHAVVEYAKPSKVSPVPSVAALLAADQAAAPKPERTKQPRKPKGAGHAFIINKPFKPRTNHISEEEARGKFAQQANWDALVACMDEHEDGATYEQLVQALTEAAAAGGYTQWANVPGFIAGRIRGEHITAI